MWLRVHIAVAVAQTRGYSSNWTSSPETSICRRCDPKKTKRQKKKKKIKELMSDWKQNFLNISA